MPDCPTCNSSLHMIHRRRIDRLISRLTPVLRYHCPKCSWRGNLPDPAKALADRGPWLSWVFVFLTTLAVGGVISVGLYVLGGPGVAR